MYHVLTGVAEASTTAYVVIQIADALAAESMVPARASLNER